MTSGIYVSKDRLDNLGRLENAMHLNEISQNASQKIKKAIKSGYLPNKPVHDLIDISFEKNLINLQDKHQLHDAKTAMLDAVQVDEYTLEDYHKI